MLNLEQSTILFKKLIILFWALWWLIALWTDVVGGLAHFSGLAKTWAPDTNYPFLAASLKMYNVPEWFVFLLFLGILIGLIISSLAFWWAVVSFGKEDKIWLQRADLAFKMSLIFWFVFFLADQVVMKFDLEENHMVQGGFQFLTYLALYLLPGSKP